MVKELTYEGKMLIIQNNGAEQKNLLNILIELQFASKEGYIDQETAALVAQEIGITETRVYEVITFYSMLKTKPQAKYVLKICNNTPCYFSKANHITDILREELQVGIGEDTEDGIFAYHYIPCIGACDIGPVIKIKDTVYGNLNEEKIRQLLQDLRSGLRDQ